MVWTNRSFLVMSTTTAAAIPNAVVRSTGIMGMMRSMVGMRVTRLMAMLVGIGEGIAGTEQPERTRTGVRTGLTWSLTTSRAGEEYEDYSHAQWCRKNENNRIHKTGSGLTATKCAAVSFLARNIRPRFQTFAGQPVLPGAKSKPSQRNTTEISSVAP